MNTIPLKNRYSFGEEVANSITHGIGAVLAIAGLAILVALATLRGDVWHIVSCSVYGATLVFMYVASTLYHSAQVPQAKSVLRIIDHCAIFVLIAGTYTPFTLVNLRGTLGWSLFGGVWGVALLGVVLECCFRGKGRTGSLILYVVMGWSMVAAVKPMFDAVPAGGLILLLLGGLCYTGGIGFYVWRKLPYHHAYWHLFVLAGSVFHFFAVLFFVIPAPAT